MFCQHIVFYRPIDNVIIAMRQHGRAPDIAQASEGKRWFQTRVTAAPGNFFTCLAVWKIRTENQLQFHAPGIRSQPAFQHGQLFGSPLGRFDARALADNPRAVRFKFQTGIQHEHASTAREQGLRARDARRAGTNNAVHIRGASRDAPGRQLKSFCCGMIAAMTIELSCPPRLRQNPPAMSRFRRTFHGVASSYILLAATAVYTLASVPVALHYLAPPPDHDLARFGLWMVMGTLVGYLNLMDAGMTWAVARLLVDHKDDQNSGSYGSLIQTGWLVSVVQGAIIFVMGLLLAGTFARLLLPLAPALHPELTQLIRWQCGIVALTFATRMLNLILTAHQRMDLSNYIGVASLLMNFAAQWIFFHLGFGVLSLVLGGLVALVTAVVCSLPACIVLKLFPAGWPLGRVSWQNFLGIV